MNKIMTFFCNASHILISLILIWWFGLILLFSKKYINSTNNIDNAPLIFILIAPYFIYLGISNIITTIKECSQDTSKEKEVNNK